tara:strand:+ start:159 stop:422 length:264 start_codon:yes stop_codon:yes gene_type:complete
MLIKNKSELFVFSAITLDKKSLLPSLLNRNILGVKNQIFIRECFDAKDRYEVYVSKIGDKYQYLYSLGKAKATTVVRIAEKFKIELK